MPERDERPRRAAALRYDRESGRPPRVVAVGSGEVADRILERARASGVPVREDSGLAEALARLELEAEIPPELWVAVAETLVWAYGIGR
jgi:flagellar biosynthesis protein